MSGTEVVFSYPAQIQMRLVVGDDGTVAVTESALMPVQHRGPEPADFAGPELTEPDEAAATVAAEWLENHDWPVPEELTADGIC